MPYLISNRKTEDFTLEIRQNYTIMPETGFLAMFKDFLGKASIIILDFETNGLDPHVNKPILCLIKVGDARVAIDSHNVSKAFFTAIIHAIKDSGLRVVGHNIKFDIKFAYTNTIGNVLLTYVYDTMVAEQRLYQKLGLRAGLDFVNARYRNVEVDDMDKTIRMEFVGADPEYFKLELRHLDYGLGDVDYLEEIKLVQDKRTYKNNLYGLIYKIEMPLIPILALAEVTGFEFDLQKWNDIAQRNLDRKLIVEQELDVIFRKLREETEHTQEERLRCIGGKFDHKRVLSPLYKEFELDGTPKAIDLFGNKSTRKAVTGRKSKINFYPLDINYGSDAQVIAIFGHLKESTMTKQGTYEEPQFKRNGKVNKEFYSFLTNEDVLVKYMLDFPKSRMNPFIEKLLEQRKLNTRINNFGVKYESKLNKVTGRLHTTYRQAFAATGRLQSGGGDLEPDKPNFQNIPADKEMRSCFIARKGRKIITADYSGAELVVMCSHSQDMKLLEISKGDMHSYIATKCWRAVYRHRQITLQAELDNYNSSIERGELSRLIDKYNDLANNFVVDSSPERKHLRTAFKPITFGVIYGLRYKALALVLSISEDEAKAIINVIEQTFPKVIRFVKDMAKFAQNNGYLVLNNRAKDRVYFPNIIKHLKGEYSMDYHFVEIMKDVNEARNISIQGTQATAIKEATVKLQGFIDKHNIDAILLNFVHDEIITDIANEDLYKEYTIGDTVFKNFAEVKEYIMCDTFNKYLNNVTIGVDYDIADCWVK